MSKKPRIITREERLSELLSLASADAQYSRCCGGHTVRSQYVCPWCDSNEPSAYCEKERIVESIYATTYITQLPDEGPWWYFSPKGWIKITKKRTWGIEQEDVFCDVIYRGVRKGRKKWMGRSKRS